MPGFRRVHTQFPGNAVLANIESVDILDVPPPALPLGAGTGTLLLAAEFDGFPVNQPTRISSPTDQTAKLGGLGFPSALSAHDGAVARKSGGDELWNGNGFIWMRNKRFATIIVVRVDNSAGEVAFRRLACLTGGAGPFAATTADAITFEVNGASTAVATVTAAKGQINATGASYPAALDGLTFEVIVDGDVSRLITFSSTTTMALVDVIAQINATLAQTIASDNAGQLRLESTIAGGSGYIEATGSAGTLVLLGLPPVITPQVDTWTVNLVTAGLYTLRTQLLVAGQLTNFDASATRVAETDTQFRDVLLIQMEALTVPGVTFAASGATDITAVGNPNVLFTSSVEVEPTPGDVTIALTLPGVAQAAFGTGNVLNILNFTATEMATIIDAVANVSSEVDSDGNLRTCNTLTPSTGTLEAVSGPLVPILGYTVGVVADAADAEDVTIPAGTIVRGTSPATDWVTLQDIETGAAGGPWDAKVRPFTDTDTALANSIGQITTIVSTLPDGFSVTNAAAVTRLSSSQLDARYATALDATLDLSSEAADADFVTSARASDSIMRKLFENAGTASANGLAPRKAIVRPLLGTSLVDAQGSGVMGVAIQRSDRRQYAFPGVTTQIPEIQSVGARGGTGFTEDGIINVGSDGFLASAASILNPEENAGQRLSDTNVRALNILSLEDTYNSAKGGQGLTMADYIALKASGITAPRISQSSGAIFQSDVTTVDPATDSNIADASRRRLADFIIKSAENIGLPFVKKLNTIKRRIALQNQLNAFLRGLQSPDSLDFSRIEDFVVVDTSTDIQRAAGIQAFDMRVRSYPAMLTVFIRVEVGTTVVIEEQ